VALMTVNNEQAVGANLLCLCVLIKVLYLRKTKLISRPAVLRDPNNLVMGYIASLVLA
jgi:hypothetical protein